MIHKQMALWSLPFRTGRNRRDIFVFVVVCLPGQSELSSVPGRTDQLSAMTESPDEMAYIPSERTSNPS